MPKSDTWPGGVAMESLISMDSTGSCDSVVSMNSGFSDDSLEHLSAEERACLMFLESTIESLEIEEDSGLSNDEPDPSSLAAKPGHLSMGQARLEDVSELQHSDSGRDQKSFLNCIVPTPLRVANSLASIQLKAPGSATQPTAPAAAIEPRAPAPVVATQLNTPGAFTDLKPPGVVTEPTVSEVVTERKAPEIATVPKSPELMTDIKSPGLDTISKVPVLSTESKTPELAADPKASASDTTPSSATSDNSVDNMPKGVSVDSKSAKRQSKVHSELDLKLIPPPSDFRDDEPEEESELPVPAVLRVPLNYSELEQLRRRAPPASPGAQQTPPSKPPVDLPVPVSTNSPPSHSEALTIPIPETLETKNPPAVAPKPKRLPSNIIQKSHKSDSHPGPPLSLPIDRSIIDPQKVRLEALRKLGLLKGEDGDSGPVVSPKSRKSWAPTPSPRSPDATQTQAPAQIPTTSPATTPGQVPATIHTPIPVPAAVAVPATTEPARATTLAPLPAPIQFSDNAKALLLPLTTPPSPPKHIPPPVRVKSATLERSSMGQRSYMASNASLRANQAPSVPLSPRDQRNSRPRPASLGTGKDFMNVQGEACHPQPGHGESQNKLPRSHGISVLICPNSKRGEDRREALKKLGLLSD
ncbi:specifically androgen-regulated gene protein [Oncorhynchus tshawytscha]|uniref:Specifically androgen-regulated gene protein n=1 Tax=Oncorhynchus tshawytscha TaxID=74940 RepID=A0A8C8FSP4_ONCTS|nr:specifically androgen-regulated gene protein [Oncorhynchus tshawytscha]